MTYSNDINIIYEDNHLLVAEKPVNMPSQADESKDADILAVLKEYLKHKYDKPGNIYLGLIHRLDRPVGGVMAFAKTSKAASRLSEQIRSREFKKTYLAVIHGKTDKPCGRLEHHLLKDTKTNTVKAVKKPIPGSKEAILDYETIEGSKELSLVKIRLYTGRSHQIRVQFSSIGHPLYGDQKYGTSLNKIGQQIALWSYEIKCKHPTRQEEMIFKCKPHDEKPWNLFKTHSLY